MEKKNRVEKLTDRKIRYIIRAKIRGNSTNRIAQDMKLKSIHWERVWMHWRKTKRQLNIKKFGRKKKTLDEESTNGDRVKWLIKNVICGSEYIKSKHSGLHRHLDE
jgi:hypothetical protein